MKIQNLFLGLILSTFAFPQAPPAPDPATQDRILESMHEYADKYVSNLPNFICDQVTREFESDQKPGKWRKGDVVVSQLSFHDGREERAMKTVNGKKAKPGARRPPLPLNTEGEFGGLLSKVLGKESEAYFKWNRWEEVRGKQLAVFDFQVDRERSSLNLLNDVAKAVVGYEGSVYADSDSGAVSRITYTAKNIPAAIQIKKISTTVDYGETVIGTKSYLLPLQATVNMALWLKDVRNELAFQAYRKFGAESSITFDPPK